MNERTKSIYAADQLLFKVKREDYDEITKDLTTLEVQAMMAVLVSNIGFNLARIINNKEDKLYGKPVRNTTK
jgi:hypothetical protein